MGRKLPYNTKLSLFYVQTFGAMYSHIHQVLYIEFSYRIHRTVAFAFICFLEKDHTYFMQQKHSLQVKIKPRSSKTNPVIGQCRK